MVWRMQRWCPYRRCAGILGRIAPASSPTLRCRCCRHCSGIIALVAWALLPSLRWHCCPVAFASPPALQTGICLIKQLRHALVSLPASRRCRCWRRAGIIALVAWASLPLLHWCCCPWHTRVAASIMNWHLPSHDAVATCCW